MTTRSRSAAWPPLPGIECRKHHNQKVTVATNLFTIKEVAAQRGLAPSSIRARLSRHQPLFIRPSTKSVSSPDDSTREVHGANRRPIRPPARLLVLEPARQQAKGHGSSCLVPLLWRAPPRRLSMRRILARRFLLLLLDNAPCNMRRNVRHYGPPGRKAKNPCQLSCQTVLSLANLDRETGGDHDLGRRDSWERTADCGSCR